MEVIYPRCAGLDVHKQTVVACVRIAGDGPPLQQVRTFDTTTSGLLALADWLECFGVEHVAMEATGVYWKPVWHVLEGHFELVLANAAHVKNVPGRKTDVNDAMWLADLLAHGLHRRPRHGRGHGAAPAAARRDRRRDHRQVPDGHGQGRRPRHRQEPGQHHARGRRLGGDRPRRPGRAGEVRRGDRGAPAGHRRVLGVPHHHDADVQGQHERAGEGRPAGQGPRSWSAVRPSRRSTPTQ